MADTKESTNKNLQIEKIQAFLKQYCADTEFEVRLATKDDLAEVLKTLESIARFGQEFRSDLQKYKEIDLENTLYLDTEEIRRDTNRRGYHFLQYMEFDHRTIIYHLYPIDIFLQHIESFVSRLEQEKLSILDLTERFNVNYNLFNENRRYLSDNNVHISLDPANSLFNPSEHIMLRFNAQNSLQFHVHNLIALGFPPHHLTIKDIWCTFPMRAITQNAKKINLEEVKEFLSQYCPNMKFNVRYSHKGDMINQYNVGNPNEVKGNDGVQGFESKKNLDDTVFIDIKPWDSDRYYRPSVGVHFLRFMGYNRVTVDACVYQFNDFRDKMEKFKFALHQKKFTMDALFDQFQKNSILYKGVKNYFEGRRINVYFEVDNSLFEHTDKILLSATETDDVITGKRTKELLIEAGVKVLCIQTVRDHPIFPRHILPLSLFITENKTEASLQHSQVSVQHSQALVQHSQMLVQHSQMSAQHSQASAPSQPFLPSQATVVSADATQVVINTQAQSEQNQSGHNKSEQNKSEQNKSDHNKSEQNKSDYNKITNS